MKKLSKFKIGLFSYIAVLVVLIVVLLIYTYNSMKKYEDSQADKVMENFIEELKEGKIPEISTGTSNKFENINEEVLSVFENLKDEEVSYDIKSSSYDSTTYNLKLDDETIATVVLKAANHKKMFFLLTVCDWNVASVSAIVPNGTKEVTITVPSDYIVKINGIELSDLEAKGEPESLVELKYVAEYTEVPTFTTYYVGGLVNEPEIKVVDSLGNESVIPYEKEISLTYEESDMPQELSDYVLQAARDYSNFFSRDLEGCSTSTAGIDKYFPKGSMYIELAENYRQHDMWMYSGHHGTEIYDEAVTEYIVYNDELFSCNVAFEKKMILTATNETRMDSMNQTFYYVKIDGQWLIAAMIDNAE